MQPNCFMCFFASCWKSLWLFCCLLLVASEALADNWEASIYEDAAPAKLVGVDKKHKIFNFYEKKSPLRLRYSYPCVTGQLQGDKQQLNDLRTPEGIYFVEYKIANGLDFKEYGGIAYTLNYPNPVDRLRGKTGYGIWIHSKGFDLVPTRGCVAINLKNIAEIGPHLLPGTPVVLAEELKNINGSDPGELEELRQLMMAWSTAWEGRTDKLFEFYDPNAYSRATENFDLFKRNKERLFKILSFIKIYNREIHVLEGPGYWVTWSEQLYTASNLSTEGIRRLYWQKDDKGKFRIVGMEWTPRDMGMQAEVQQGKLVAESTPAAISDASSEAPVPPRLDMPEKAPVLAGSMPKEKAEASETGGRKRLGASIAALAENLRGAGEPLLPGPKPVIKDPDEIEWGKGRTLTPIQEENTQAQPEKPKETLPNLEEKADGKDQEKTINVQPEKTVKTAKTSDPVEDMRALENAVKGWSAAYKARNPSITVYYDQKNFNRLNTKDAPRGASYNSILQTIQKDMSQPWLEILLHPADLELHGPVAKSRTNLMIISPLGMRQGVQTLWWHKDAEDKYRIVASEFKPQALGMEANYLENISADISSMLEAWRKAWETASLEEYMTYYTPDAVQQGRVGQKLIRRQKEDLWQRKKPVQVQLSGLRLAMDQKGVRADMNQIYADSLGTSDRGIKTLLLRYDNGAWKIQREDWANLAPAPVVKVKP